MRLPHHHGDERRSSTSSISSARISTDYSRETVQMFYHGRGGGRLSDQARRRVARRESTGRGMNMERLFRQGAGDRRRRLLRGRLVPQLLARGYKVTVYDIMYFGNEFLPKTTPTCASSKAISATPRKFAAAVAGMTRSSISPASRTTPASSSTRSCRTSINSTAFEPMVVAAKKAGVKRFVYASSSSVYGVSDNARRHRGPSARAAHALQQVQGHVRAAAVEAHGRRASPA